MKEKETWKDVIGFEGKYQISNYGRVKSNRVVANRIMKVRTDTNGYPQAFFCVNYKVIPFRVSRLVAIHFLESVKDKNEVNHIDGNKLNNYYKNLEWVNRKENCTHRNLLHNKNKTSKFIGVYLKNGTNKWASELRYNGMKYYIGLFNTQEEAHEAYIKKCNDLKIKNKYLTL